MTRLRKHCSATLSAMAAGSLLLAGAASAQDREHERGGREGPRAAEAPQARGPAPAQRTAPPTYRAPAPSAAPPPSRGTYEAQRPSSWQGAPAGAYGRPAPSARDTGRTWGRDPRADRGGADRHEWRYRGQVHPGFRVAPFRYPGGWGYRSWRIGERLPFLFLTSYYFLDAYAYDLPPAPYGCRWVRYGPDALLVNVYSGEVEDVIYGVFYW